MGRPAAHGRADPLRPWSFGLILTIVLLYAWIVLANWRPGFLEVDPQAYRFMAHRFASLQWPVQDADPFLHQDHVWVRARSEPDRPEQVAPKYPPGYPLLAAPLVRLFGDVGFFALNPILGALTLAGVFSLARNWLHRGWAALACLLLLPAHAFIVFTLYPLAHMADLAVTVWGMAMALQWIGPASHDEPDPAAPLARERPTDNCNGHSSPAPPAHNLGGRPEHPDHPDNKDAQPATASLAPGRPDAVSTARTGPEIFGLFAAMLFGLAAAIRPTSLVWALAWIAAWCERQRRAARQAPPAPTGDDVPPRHDVSGRRGPRVASRVARAIRRPPWIASLGWIPPLAGLAAYQFRLFGSPLSTGYARSREQAAFAFSHFLDHIGPTLSLLFRAELGIFLPLGLLALAWPWVSRQARWGGQGLLAAWMLPFLLIYPSYYWFMNNPGYSRFYGPLLPAFVVLGLAWLVGRLPPRPLVHAIVAAALIAASGAWFHPTLTPMLRGVGPSGQHKVGAYPAARALARETGLDDALWLAEPPMQFVNVQGVALDTFRRSHVRTLADHSNPARPRGETARLDRIVSFYRSKRPAQMRRTAEAWLRERAGRGEIALFVRTTDREKAAARLNVESSSFALTLRGAVELVRSDGRSMGTWGLFELTPTPADDP